MKKYICALAALTGIFAATTANANVTEKQCLPVGGVALGQFYNGGSDVVAPMLGTFAAARGSVKGQKETATGLLLEMEHAFSTSDGAVVSTRDVAELTKIPGKKDTYLLELAYTVNESYGRLKGYSGTFNSRGSINLATGEALVRYSGQICK